MCGSPKPPPPPKDYSGQVNAFRDQQQNTYDSQANSFNTAATAFNNNLSSFGSKVSEGSSKFGNLSISDPARLDEAASFWGGLRTEATSPWSAGDKTFSGLTGFDIAKPNFQSVVMTPFGGQSASLNVPSLVEVDTQRGFGYLDTINQNLGKVDQLRRDREAEKARVQQFQSQYAGGLANLESSLGRYDYASDLSPIETQLNNLEQQRRGFSSALIGEYADFFGANPTAQDYNDITAGLSSLRQQRAAEEARIKQFTDTNLGLFNSAYSQLEGMGVADWSRAEELDKQIDAAARAMRQFDSKLAPDFSRVLAAYQDADQKVEGLRSNYTSTQNQIKSFENSLLQRARALAGQAEVTGITDPKQFDALAKQVAALRQDAAGFQSPLTFDLTDELAPLDQVQQRLTTLRASHDSEKARIDAKRAELAGKLADIKNRANTLTIADMDAIKAIDAELSDLDAASRDFSAELPFDFSSLYGQFGDVDRKLADLYGQRAIEEGRVGSARSGAESAAQTILRNLNLGNMRDGSMLKAYESDIAAAKDQIGGFSSVLGADFSKAAGVLTQAEQRLAELRAARAAELGEYTTQADALRGEIQGLDLWDTNALNLRRSRASSELNELAGFTGEDAEAAREAIRAVLELSDARTAELGTKRSALETQAKGFFNGLEGNAFYGEDDLGARFAEYRALQDEVSKYGASQASDELADISNLFGSERTRLKNDAATRAKVAAAERAAGEDQIAQNNLKGFFAKLRTSPFAGADYADLIEMLGNGGAPSSFSRNLGLG